MKAKFGKKAYTGLALGAVGCYFTFIDGNGSNVIDTAFQRGHRDDLNVDVLNSFIFTVACLGLVGLFDFLLGRLFVGRWFAVHAMVNAILVIWCASDAIALFSLPNVYFSTTCETPGVPCAPHAPLCLSLALHIWHGLAYPLKAIDLIHHVPNWILTSMCIYYQWGPMQGFSLFWALMGIPGMIDYSLLVGVKQGWISPGVEKRWNETLNVWLRSPFCSICAFILLASIFNHPDIFISKTQIFVQFVNGVHCGWNGQFFMARTVDARARYDMARKAAKNASQEKEN